MLQTIRLPASAVHTTSGNNVLAQILDTAKIQAGAEIVSP